MAGGLFAYPPPRNAPRKRCQALIAKAHREPHRKYKHNIKHIRLRVTAGSLGALRISPKTGSLARSFLAAGSLGILKALLSHEDPSGSEPSTDRSPRNAAPETVPLPPKLRTRNTLKSPDGPTTLYPDHLLLIEYVVYGCHSALLCRRQGVEVGAPLRLEQAADILGIKRRHARYLAGFPIFQRAMAKAVADLRSGAAAKATRKMIDLIDEPGARKAADRKVNLDAAKAVLGEEAKHPSVNVGVTVNNAVAITPGYVIDLSEPSTIDQ